MNFMFDLEDASNDGAIDATEFALVCSSYGLDKAECEVAFGKMSQVNQLKSFIPFDKLNHEALFVPFPRAKRKLLENNLPFCGKNSGNQMIQQPRVISSSARMDFNPAELYSRFTFYVSIKKIVEASFVKSTLWRKKISLSILRSFEIKANL
jgi:hypothetical protein